MVVYTMSTNGGQRQYHRQKRKTSMRIHHFTIPAYDTKRVASLLAELLGAHVVPMPHPHDSLLVYAGDADGSAIEVWPAVMRTSADLRELQVRDLPLPEAWPHHGY